MVPNAEYKIDEEEIGSLRLLTKELVDALEEIRQGSIDRRPGHCDYHANRTKIQIGVIAANALAKARGEA